MILRLTLLALFLPLVAACAGPPVIAMWKPATGEFHDCKSGEVSYLIELHPATECAEAYKRMGWQIY
jgi:hypothetical protein